MLLPFQVQDLIAFHESKHTECQSVYAMLSNDGVNECNSNNISLDVFSICFAGCKIWHPIIILKKLDAAYDFNKEKYLVDLINDLK